MKHILALISVLSGGLVLLFAIGLTSLHSEGSVLQVLASPISVSLWMAALTMTVSMAAVGVIEAVERKSKGL